jgi:RNA polymerase sigma-70 factor (ECF subfamily)
MLSSATFAPRIARPGTIRKAASTMDGPDPLITRAQAGDETAFTELFRRHRGDVTRLVYRVIGPSADVEDVVQDVFVHVYRSLPRFRGDSKFSTWLYRLTVNVARMHLRRGRSRPRFADVPVPEAPRDGLPIETPDRQAERAERVAALYRLLEDLSEKKRTVLVLHDFEGVAAKEIAGMVEAPVLTVRTRLFYARKELYAAIARDPRLGPAVEALMSELPGKPEQGADAAPEQGADEVAQESKRARGASAPAEEEP